MTLEIGTRLRSIREIHGLSQRKLAKRTKVSHATISLIEQNRMNPSVGMLLKLLAGFPISLVEFWSMETTPHQKVFFSKGDFVKMGGDLISYLQLGGSPDQRALLIQYERYEPGADTGETMLKHEGEEAGFIISGEMEIIVGDQRRLLAPGDAYYFDSRIPHRFRNRGKLPSELVSACTPPSF